MHSQVKRLKGFVKSASLSSKSSLNFMARAVEDARIPLHFDPIYYF